MSEKERVLAPPPLAESSPDAIEVLRVWARPNNPQQVVLRTTWKDPGAWGLLLADLARHAAKAYEKEGHDQQKTLVRIRAAFEAEWQYPTDEPKDIA